MPPSSATPADLLIECRWVLPMIDNVTELEWQGVAIAEDRIIGIWPVEEARQRVTPHKTLRLEHHALLPGFVNAHNHAGMTLLRGYADDLPLMTWLKEHIWPAEAAFMNTDTVTDGTRLAIAEMLRTGTTTFSDMYFAPEKIAELAEQMGIRAQLCTPLIDFETPWSKNFADGLEKTRALVSQHGNKKRLSFAFGPHAPYTVGDDSLAQLREARDQLGLPIQMHVHETADEINQALAHNGIRPLRRLYDAGLLDPTFQAVHMTQLNDEDFAIIKESGVNIVHCPQSNLKLASGFCPVAKLLEENTTVALGTDGACSNNDLDMLDEMRTAALLAKGVSGNAEALPAMATLAMSTREGAKALGLGERIGQIKAGFEADLIAIDLDSIESLPVHNPASAIVYAVNSRQVSHVWVGGRILLNEGRFVHEDEDELKALAKSRQAQMNHKMSHKEAAQ
ncbi:TRZ/ATZ family hydrolase [Phytohalomonas tamaricis]|uniref:TRZ/ATZ family hydrolase n=1 Tax=Phytohalomonas tamaricis TaxID=2081032 RepID=UPI000D0AFEE7|nr:TRZ/ATZ family hydrolase [Phytohalomonas tamaricis]